MFRRLLFIFTVTLLFFSSCRKDFGWVPDQQKKSILFSSKISGQVLTRMSGSQWDNNDSISVFMYHGDALNQNTVLSEGFNKQFITNSSGNFSPKTTADAMNFPADKEVRFVAFYPYKNSLDFQRYLDISDQEDQDQIDYLLGKSASSLGSQQGAVQLKFERIMSKIQVRVKAKGIQAVTAKLSPLLTAAIFQIGQAELNPQKTFKDVSGKVISTGEETVIEWVVFPGKLESQTRMVFKSNTGETFTWEIGKLGTEYEQGNRYSYDINLSDGGIVDPKPAVSYMELPVISNSTELEYNFKMTPDRSKRNYSMLYDKKNRIAHWVAYPLSKDYLGRQSRTNRWAFDPNFPDYTQPLLRKGFGVSGIDRGHQIPSADRTRNAAENATTFYYTNMTAQTSSLNQGVWAKLENQIRSWTTASGVDTMYVVTGAGLSFANGSIDYVQDNQGNRVAKPKYYYKALAVKRGTAYYTIGFYMENKVTPTKANFSSYRMTVSELERKTGYQFFPGIPRETKNKINDAIWR